MLDSSILEIAKKMRGPDRGRVLVLDVDYSATRYKIPLAMRASRHAYYFRPPDGLNANDLKKILDEAGGEEELMFRYYVYPELETDLKPLLTADLYAEKHFGRNDGRKLLQVEGERPHAREVMAEILNGLKDPFKAEEFPRIDEFVLSSFRPWTEDRPAEIVLLRRDGKRDELRKAEPGFHIALAEHGFAKEIQLYRPVVGETEPTLIFTSNEHTGELGPKFLTDLAAYFGTALYAERSELADKVAVAAVTTATPRTPTITHHASPAPVVQPVRVDPQQLVVRLAAALKDLLPGMKLLQKREITRGANYLTMPFPGVMGFGKGPSPKEMKELESVFRALKGDPSFGTGWKPYYQVDAKTGELKIAPLLDSSPTQGWTAL